MFGLFKRRNRRMGDDEVNARLWLALNDKAQLHATANAIRRIVGEKLTDEQRRKCAEAITVKWVGLVAGGNPDVDNIVRMVRNSYSWLSHVETAEIVRLVTEAELKSYPAVLSRIREIRVGPAPQHSNTTRSSAASAADAKPTVYLNVHSAEQIVKLKSNAGEVETSMAVLITILLMARQKGWAGGAHLFDKVGGTDAIGPISTATISGRDARSLRLELEPFVAELPSSPELQPLLDFMALLDGSDMHIVAQ